MMGFAWELVDRLTSLMGLWTHHEYMVLLISIQTDKDLNLNHFCSLSYSMAEALTLNWKLKRYLDAFGTKFL